MENQITEEILEDVDILDLNSLCRLCSNASEDQLIGIFEDYSDDNFAKKIMAYLPIKVSHDDVLPVKICVICNDILIKWNEFYQNCLNADERFRKMLAEEKLEENISYSKHLNDEDNIVEEKDTDWEQTLDFIVTNSDEELDDMAVSSIANEDQIDGYNFEECSKSGGEEVNEADQSTSQRLCSCNQEEEVCKICTSLSSDIIKSPKHNIFGNNCKTENSSPDEQNLCKGIQCEICDEYVETRTELRIHLKQHKDIFCSICAKVFKTYNNLLGHKKLHQEHMATYDCPICGLNMNRKYNLMVHINSHTADYPCRICCASFNSLLLLDHHKLTHQREELDEYNFIQNNIKCYECTEMFISRYELYVHTVSEHNDQERKNICYCGRIFEAEIMLRMHIKTQHTTLFECSVCKKKFKKQKGLQEHENTHLNHRPYKCDDCGKTFRYSSNLSQHRTIHKGVRNFECIECGKAFLRSNTLATHLKSHQNIRKYACELCEASFVQSSSLVKHRRTIHRTCERCGEIVGDKKQMYIHVWKDCGDGKA